MRVVVVGAGIAGLTAGWELLRSAKGRCDVTILESERRSGGIILTERHTGFIIEAGPDGWLATESEIPALASELKIDNRVVEQRARGSFVWTGTALEPLPEGQAAAMLGIQVKTDALAAGFQSFSAGMGELVEALTSQLGARIRAPVGISGLVRSGTGWRLAVTGGAGLEADAVVLAIPAFGAGRLLEQAGVAHARDLGEVVYMPSVTVSLAYRADQISRPLDGTGFVVQSNAAGASQLRACTYASQKFPGRAPDGHVLLRAFMDPATEDPSNRAHTELASILQISGGPLWSRTFYWTKGIPRYPRGHVEQVARVRARLDSGRRLPPLAVAGAGYDGPGISACVRSGREAASYLLSRLVP